MNITRKIRVLVVDDSIMFREAIARGISKDPGIEVVATASDAYSARDKILEFKPDVMTLDVEMPKMNGIEFLRRLMPQYPMPVVVVSAVSKNVFDALNAGAVDFVTKPDVKTGKGIEYLISELSIKIKIASTANISLQKKSNTPDMRSISGQENHQNLKNTLIAIGASTGGTEAIGQIIKMFPRDMPGTIIVQHMPPVFTRIYAERLNDLCAVEVKEAETGDEVRRGRVLIAPGDYHMVVRKKAGGYFVECLKGEKVNGHCPSVDVLFNSVAEQAGESSVGVILTGMGYDGAKGLLSMKRKGAYTLGQDEASSVVYGMPRVAFDIGAVIKQVPLGGMARAIYSNIDKR